MSLDLTAAVLCITLGALTALDGLNAWRGAPPDPSPEGWATDADVYVLGTPDGAP